MMKIRLLLSLLPAILLAFPVYATSIWGAADTAPAAGTDRLPVDTGSSSSPGYLEVDDVAAYTRTAVTVASETSDTTSFPLFVTAATGDLAPKTSSYLTFDAVTGGLTVAGGLTAAGITASGGQSVLANYHLMSGTGSPAGNGMYYPATNTPAITARSLAAATFTNPASAVNYFTFTGNTTGNPPTIGNAGTDTNGAGLGLAITAKAASASGNGGGITITTGAANTSGTGGDVTVTLGAGASGNGGKINATTANTLTAPAGSLSAHTFPPAAIWGQMNTNPGSASTAVTSGIVGYNTHTGSGLSGNGHNIGVLGVTENATTNTVGQMFGVEGRFQQSAAGTVTTFAAFIGAAQTVTEGALGTLSIYIDYYCANLSDHAYISSKYCLLNTDSTKAIQTAGKVVLASSQEASGQGSIPAARYYGPKGGNDIGGLGAGGVAMADGNMYCTIVHVKEKMVADSLQAEVLTDSGGDLRFCTYRLTAGACAALVEDGGAVAVTGTGVKTDTATGTYNAGDVCVCVAQQGAGLTIDFDVVTNYHEVYGVSSTRAAGEAAFLAAGVTGACPDPSGAVIAATSTLTPGVGISPQ